MDRSTPFPGATHAHVPPTGAVCPYLLAADRAWRAATPARDHRCTAVTPAAVLAPDKQRRLCLAVEHQGCSTFRAALEGHAGGAGDAQALTRSGGRTPLRAFARTAPLVLDHGRVNVTMPNLRPERGVGQFGLASLMGLALVAVVIARVPGLTPGDGRPGAGGAAASPSATPGVTRPPASTDEPKPTGAPAATDAPPARTLVPTEVEPSEPAETTSPSASAGGETYQVRRGDTLSGIAGEFGTTWQALAQLNGIEDPSRLKVGQILQLP